jgi:hypothetical protein
MAGVGEGQEVGRLKWNVGSCERAGVGHRSASASREHAGFSPQGPLAGRQGVSARLFTDILLQFVMTVDRVE